MCGIDSSFLVMTQRFRSPFQGYEFLAFPTQGDALGCDRMPLWGGRVAAGSANRTSPPSANGISPLSTNRTSPPSANGTSPPSANGISPPSTNRTSPPSAKGISPLSTNRISPPSANGAAYRSPGQRPGLDPHPEQTALKGRSKPQPTAAT